METKGLFGLTGSVALALGVFSPALLVPVLGRINYFIAGKGDGSIVIVLALMSLLFTVKKKYRALWYTGAGAGGVIVFTLISIHHNLTGANPMHVSLSWGWSVLLLGTVSVIASAAIPVRS